MANPIAAHTFSLTKAYTSERLSGAPGSGVWGNTTVIFDASASPYFPTFDGCTILSAGAMTSNLAENRGMLVQTSSGLAFIGNGTPDTPNFVLFSGDSPPVNSSSTRSYWNFSQGAWSFGGALYAIVFNRTIFMVKSTDNGATWIPKDTANGPSAVNPFDDVDAAVQRVDNVVYFFGATDDTLTEYAIWGFDLATDTWITIATVTIADFFQTATFGHWSNGLVKFPNGDFGVFYMNANMVPGDVFYRLWTKASNTWSGPINITGAGFAQVLMDPGFALLHVFTYESNVRGSAIHYSTISHPGNVVTTDVFVIPATVSMTSGGSDGVGHSSIQNSMMFVPRDDFADFDNAVWVANLSDGQFFKELLPIPAGEGGIPNVVNVNNQGINYANGDTGFVNGGDSGLTYTVSSVDGSGHILFAVFTGGTSYIPANGIVTTRSGAQPGIGTGFTVDIVSITGTNPSCAYMMFPNGYILTPSLTIACPIGGGTAIVGVPYDSGPAVVMGGTPPYHFIIVSGSLPPGMTLNPDTGAVTGITFVVGMYSYTLEVTDSSSPQLSAMVMEPCSIPVIGGAATLPCANITPNPSIDVRFKLIKVMATMKPATHLPVRGSVT